MLGFSSHVVFQYGRGLNKGVDYPGRDYTPKAVIHWPSLV